MRFDGPLLSPRTPTRALPPIKTGPQQARRRQRIVRSVLAATALLVAAHYASLLVRVQSCHRSSGGGGGSIASGYSASAPKNGAAAGASQPAAWPVAGGSGHAGASGRADSAGAGGPSDAGSATRDPHGGSRNSIPRILHQSWKDERVPKRFHKWQASWRRLHPDWEFRLWTDVDNRRLLEEHYPWFLRTYDALPKPIMRADAIRPFYMHRHGGVYADLDVEALRPMDGLLRGGRPVLAFLSATWWLRHNIPNAWMASPPGHEFWQFCWAHTMLEFRPDITEGDYFNEGIERVTGPRALMDSLDAYAAATGRNVTVLPPGQVFAYDWHRVTWCRTEDCIRRVQECGANEPTFDPEACKAHYPDAYAITYWSHTWGDKKEGAKGKAKGKGSGKKRAGGQSSSAQAAAGKAAAASAALQEAAATADATAQSSAAQQAAAAGGTASDGDEGAGREAAQQPVATDTGLADADPAATDAVAALAGSSKAGGQAAGTASAAGAQTAADPRGAASDTAALHTTAAQQAAAGHEAAAGATGQQAAAADNTAAGEKTQQPGAELAAAVHDALAAEGDAAGQGADA